MKIELKNIKVNETFSEETTMFKANIYVDGKIVGDCNNDGHGGSTYCHSYSPETKEKFKELEQYCETLPPIVYPPMFEGDKEMSIPCNLEHLVDQLLDEHLHKKDKEKFEKKTKKDMLKGIVIGSDVIGTYRLVSWKNLTIQQLLDTPMGRKSITDTIKKYTKDGFHILNTNIPQELY